MFECPGINDQPMCKANGMWFVWFRPANGGNSLRLWRWWHPADWPVRIRQWRWERRYW